MSNEKNRPDTLQKNMQNSCEKHLDDQTSEFRKFPFLNKLFQWQAASWTFDMNRICNLSFETTKSDEGRRTGNAPVTKFKFWGAQRHNRHSDGEGENGNVDAKHSYVKSTEVVIKEQQKNNDAEVAATTRWDCECQKEKTQTQKLLNMQIFTKFKYK